MTEKLPKPKIGVKKKVVKKKVDKEIIPTRQYTPMEKTPSGEVRPTETVTEIEKEFKMASFSGDEEGINSIEKIINSQIKEEKESKEIFITKQIEARTDVNDVEISVISRLQFLCEELHLHNLNSTLNKFMTLRLSKGRKSRKEFIESLKMRENNNMFPMGGMQGQNGQFFR